MRITPLLLTLLLAALLSGCASPAITPAANTLPPVPAATPIPPVPTLASLPPTPTPVQVLAPTPAQPEPIQFAAGAVMSQVPVSLPAGTSKRFVFGALQGQLVTIELTLSTDKTAAVPASFSLTGADGITLTAGDTTRWKAALITSQDYFIEIKSLSDQPAELTLLLAIPALGSTPYVPVSPEVCQILSDMASQATGVSFFMEPSAYFEDYVTTETGQSCKLSFVGNGTQLPNAQAIIPALRSAFPGFEALPAYEAGGPTGESFALKRDSAVVLVSAVWQPAPGANCPADQPISACDLQPGQKLYTISIQAAMK